MLNVQSLVAMGFKERELLQSLQWPKSNNFKNEGHGVITG